MAAKEFFCDPCSDVKSIAALKYCTECEEHLCGVCVEYHQRFKMSKSHNLIELSVVGSRLPTAGNMKCDIHTDVQLDFYCNHHDAVCCRMCLPERHISCKNVYALDIASKNVRNSELLFDTFNDLKNVSETLAKLLTDREMNVKLLTQSKAKIITQIRMVKEQVLKNLDAIEQKLIEELSAFEEKKSSTVKKEKTEVSELESLLKSNIDELEFLKEHGSNNQLFLALQQQIPHTQKAESKVQQIVSSIKEIDIKFERNTQLEFKSIGSIEEITRPCDITYTRYKSQQAQVQPDTVKPLTKFEPNGEVQLKSGESYDIRGTAVTSDNKLLLCNFESSYPKVYIYKDGKTFENEITFSSSPYDVAVIPCSNTAVVTLPGEKSARIINTANNTKERKIKTRVECRGVTATKDMIYVGGDGTVHIYGTDGSEVTKLTTEGGFIYGMHYNGKNDQILIRQDDTLRCIDLNGKGLYQYKISEYEGLAVDRHGDVYTSCTNNIHRLSPDGTFRDIVLKESDGVNYPGFLSFNRDFTKLFVVSARESVSVGSVRESVLVYNCK